MRRNRRRQATRFDVFQEGATSIVLSKLLSISHVFRLPQLASYCLREPPRKRNRWKCGGNNSVISSGRILVAARATRSKKVKRHGLGMKWACIRAEKDILFHSEQLRREKPCLLRSVCCGCFGVSEVQPSINWWRYRAAFVVVVGFSRVRCLFVLYFKVVLLFEL